MSDFSKLNEVANAINEVVVGKEHQVKLAVTCMLAGGHLLIEDVPGVGKTTLASSLASALGLQYRRLQCTSDLMPSDITGCSVWDRSNDRFEFHPGPVFSQVVLADEINRAQPRSQSALLEAMEESTVTVDGVTHRLPSPFFVIATQNPTAHIGTYPLPESQLDRFMMALSLGYPSREHEVALLLGPEGRRQARTVLAPAQLLAAQDSLREIHVSQPIASYIVALARETRKGKFVEGLSPRGSLALVRASSAWAALDGKREVRPEHVRAVFMAVTEHRVRCKSGVNVGVALTDVLESVAV